MSNSFLIVNGLILISLIVLSAFFSAAETGLMSINRYRLRHKARLKKRYALLILKLLKRPDRLLGTILIGNTVANIVASSLATVLALHFFDESAVVFATIGLTMVVLIFAEVAPKTLAALYPENVSRIVAWPITILLKIFYPLVWFVNTIANSVLRILGIKFANRSIEPLSREELRSVVFETTGKVPNQYQSMLLGILDLNKVTVDDVMIPRHEVRGIDIEEDWEKVRNALASSEHERIPIYRENINQVVGVLHVCHLLNISMTSQLNKEILIKMLQEPYFIPEGTLLNIQLQNFQSKNQRMAFVVDEYGEIKGLLTLKDILEEIVGEFTSTVTSVNKSILPQPDGSFLIDGVVTIRELNRMTHWQLPTRGPRTLNGLIVEYLEAIPKIGTCLRIAGYPMEIVEVKENRVKTARVFPRLENHHEE